MSGRRSRLNRQLTAQHRPATRRRRFRHDDPLACDLFSGFGGLTRGIQLAGFETIVAANHNPYKVEVHEANNPEVEHWIADLVDPEAADYHDVRDLPAADLLVAGVSCVNHSRANTLKAYAQGLTLFDMEDPDWDARVTRAERDRATANCVLHYAAVHMPRAIGVVCTTELFSWGPGLPDRPTVGDGSTYQWWLRQFVKLGYRFQVLYLNTMFFGVPQSRDRGYWVFTLKNVPVPDLTHSPLTYCQPCDQVVEAVWTWRTGVPPTGAVRYGQQYDYRCPRCRQQVKPAMTPSLTALDLSDLGTRIGDRERPLKATTMARISRCKERFAEFPAILMPAKGVRGVERHLGQPLATQTSQQETALVSTGMVVAAHRHNGDGQPITAPMDTVTTTHEKSLVMAPQMALAIDNYQGAPRGTNQPLPTQLGSETLAIVHSGVIPFRQHTIPRTHAEPMPTVTADQMPGLVTAAGMVQNNEGIDRRVFPVTDPLRTVMASANHQGMLFSGWEHVPAAPSSPWAAEWLATLAELQVEDCHFRMMREHEVGRGCGFDTTFPDHPGSFIVWGQAREQIDGYGNAVPPAMGEWIGLRLRKVLA